MTRSIDRLALFATLFFAAMCATRADDLPAYVGEWSNGRGETLTITAKTIRFADNKAVPYRDITRATDGNSFQLQITAKGEVNAFAGKFLYLARDGDEMKMKTFASGSDLQQDSDALSEVTWFKDAD